MGDSVGRFRRYQCSTLFNHYSNLSMCGTILQKSQKRKNIQIPSKGGPEPLENEINKILCSEREDRFSDHFSDLVQNICSVRFSYLLRLSIFCQTPRDIRKFPQKCQKIAGVERASFMVPDLRSARNLTHPLRNDRVSTIPRVNHGLTQSAPVPPLLIRLNRFFYSGKNRNRSNRFFAIYCDLLRFFAICCDFLCKDLLPSMVSLLGPF